MLIVMNGRRAIHVKYMVWFSAVADTYFSRDHWCSEKMKPALAITLLVLFGQVWSRSEGNERLLEVLERVVLTLLAVTFGI